MIISSWILNLRPSSRSCLDLFRLIASTFSALLPPRTLLFSNNALHNFLTIPLVGKSPPINDIVDIVAELRQVLLVLREVLAQSDFSCILDTRSFPKILYTFSLDSGQALRESLLLNHIPFLAREWRILATFLLYLTRSSEDVAVLRRVLGLKLGELVSSGS